MSLRNLGLVAMLDLKHAPRRVMLWFWIVIIAFMTWGLSSGNVRVGSGDASVGGTQAWLTSEFAVAMIMSMLIVTIYVFFVAVAAGVPVIRDGELKVGELLHSTPLRPGEYIWGRFIAVTAIFVAVLALHMVMMIIVYHALPRAAMDEMRGPLELMNYVRPALMFGVPTIVLVGGIAFAMGTLTRKPILVFFLPVVMILACGFFLWNWSPSWLDPRINRAVDADRPHAATAGSTRPGSSSTAASSSTTTSHDPDGSTGSSSRTASSCLLLGAGSPSVVSQ